MINPTILSLAMLKVNWDARHKSYLDNFVPMVAECIRLSPDDVVSVPELQGDLLLRFGLHFPQSAFQRILKRLRAQGFVRTENRAYRPCRDRLSQLCFHSVQDDVVRAHDNLIASLVDFCRSRFDEKWDAKTAEDALISYLQEHQLVIATAASTGSLIPEVRKRSRGVRFLVGAFVRHLQQTSSADFSYLETVVKGNMLANALFLPDPGSPDRRFRNTEIYFDTKFLMYALGHAGGPRQAPCTELLDLLYETGAELRCFTHTLEETRGVLDACAHRLGSGALADAYGPSIEHFLAAGYRASDVELLIVQVERDLAGLRIRPVEKPAYEPRFVIDENGLDRALSEGIPYRNPEALRRDVDSISAIMRLRRGQEFFVLENCRAVFVTPNSALARIAREFFLPESTPGSVSPAMIDDHLTNVLWLKTPLRAPDLPRKRIIADCFAATQPDEHLWHLYLKEIDRLQERGRVTDEDYYLLRHSLEAKSALMERTLGDESVFSTGTVAEILDTVKSNIRSEAVARAEADMQSEVSLRASAEAALAAATAREARRNTRIAARARHVAKFVSAALKYTYWIVLLAVFAVTIFWDRSGSSSLALRCFLLLIEIVAAILSVGDLMQAISMKVHLRRLETSIARGIERKLLQIIEP